MLSQMVRQLFTNNPLVAYPMLALGIFVTVFFGVVLVVLAKGAASFDGAARLPLDDEEGES